ncbi:MAG: TRAP transporter TatT component family protein [Alcanivoracaceae bacterium]
MLGLSGCAVTRIGDNLPYGVLNHDDLELVGDGLPSYLLTVDGLIENWPESESLLQSGASLYSAYAGLFVDDPARAGRLSARALHYAFRAACATDRRLCDLRSLPIDEFEARLAKQRKGRVPVLFTLGTSWASYIQLNSSDWNAVAELVRVEAIMHRVVVLDETYDHGQAHMYLGVLNSILPESLGGNPELARGHYERAIALSGGRNLMAQTLFAERYARLAFDQELHDRLLDEVLAANPVAHGLTLQNTVAQREARRLRDSSADYFE